MSELLLVNPRKRRKGKRKMTAKQAKYFSPRRKRRAAASSPRRRRRASARRAAAPVARRARRTRRRSVRGFLKNTSGSLSLKPQTFIRETLIPSAIGGAGALGVDVAWGMLPLPASIKSGPMAPLAKAAGAVAVGLIASKVAGKKIGAQVTSGYLTVLAYNLLKGMVQKAMPQLPMGEVGYVQAGQFLPDQSIAAYLEAPGNAPSSGVGAYLNEYENSNAQTSYAY